MSSRIGFRLSTLLQIAGGTFLVGSTAIWYGQRRLQQRVRDLPHYMESLKIIAQHDKAREALGTPIELGRVDLSDHVHNYVDKRNGKAMLLVPVNGSQAMGFMEIRAVSDSPQGVFSTATVKLHLDDQIVTIYDTGAWKEETSPNSTTKPAAPVDDDPVV